MKRLMILPLALLVGLLVSSCSDTKKRGGQSDFEQLGSGYEHRDSTIYGLCGNESTMNRLQLITDNGDTLNLDVYEANEQGQVFGNFSVGDRMAVLVNRDSTMAIQVINVTALLGDWVMDNPLDGGSKVGISLKDGGVAESINETTLGYKSWHFINGKLEVVVTRDEEGDFEDTEVYELLYLGPDSLAYRDGGNLYEYNRPRHNPEDDMVFTPDEDDVSDGFLY